MKCSVCGKPCSYGALCLSVLSDQFDTVNLCNRCRQQLLGKEVDERVRRLVRLRGWVQPRLPI